MNKILMVSIKFKKLIQSIQKTFVHIPVSNSLNKSFLSASHMIYFKKAEYGFPHNAFKIFVTEITINRKESI